MRTLWIILLIVFLSMYSAIFAFAGSFQGVKYSVIEKSTLRSIKCTIDISLEKKVSKDFLHKLALKLRKAEPIKYDRMFIFYYLPGMTPGSGAWATSHFSPNLEVRVLGTTIQQEKALRSKSKDSSGKIIGEWLDESPYVGGKYTFLRRKGKIIMMIKFKDGSGSEEEMIQKNQSGKLRFEEKRGNDFGEYYLIERNGNLGVYDNAGLIKTMRSIK